MKKDDYYGVDEFESRQFNWCFYGTVVYLALWFVAHSFLCG